MISFSTAFEDIASPEGPSRETVRAAFDAILSGAWTPVQVAGFAVALRLRGETAPVIRAAVESLRSVMIAVDHGLPLVVDTCGTGGDGLGTINVSTAAALVVAACGVPVAKHGNRSVSSRAGSADVLEALGIPIDVPPERQADILRAANIAFLFAPAHHPAMKHGSQARRELAIRTVFNALGPASNPARATHQLIGTYEDRLRAVLASTLSELGTKRAWIVRGEEGLDEVSPFGPTRVSEVDGARVRERLIHPEDFGLSPSRPGALAGGDARDNAAATLAILRGEAHPAADAVVLNAAATLAVARELDEARAWPTVAAEAREAIRSGAALETLDRWRTLAENASRQGGPA